MNLKLDAIFRFVQTASHFLGLLGAASVQKTSHNSCLALGIEVHFLSFLIHVSEHASLVLLREFSNSSTAS